MSSSVSAAKSTEVPLCSSCIEHNFFSLSSKRTKVIFVVAFMNKTVAKSLSLHLVLSCTRPHSLHLTIFLPVMGTIFVWHLLHDKYLFRDWTPSAGQSTLFSSHSSTTSSVLSITSSVLLIVDLMFRVMYLFSWKRRTGSFFSSYEHPLFTFSISLSHNTQHSLLLS